MMKRIFAILLVCLLLWGCAHAPGQTQPTEPPSNVVGICLPDFNWTSRAQTLTQLLEAQGRQVLVEYAGGDLQKQRTQVQAFVNMPVGCILVAAVDGMTLAEPLQAALQEKIPVIALDRMLMYTDAVVGCVTADGYGAGKTVAEHIVQAKQLDSAQEPVSVEFYMDIPENQSSLLFYEGVMEVLQPYLTDGRLYCPSERISYEDVCIPDGTADSASERLFDRLAETNKAPEVICAGSDMLAAGCVDALASFGMNLDEDWPLITGMGATADALYYIDKGYQSATLFVDSDAMLQQSVQWVCKAMDGEVLTGTMGDNGIAQVPCALQQATLVDAHNYKQYMK